MVILQRTGCTSHLTRLSYLPDYLIVHIHLYPYPLPALIRPAIPILL